MEISLLANEVIKLLLPAMPFLHKLGEGIEKHAISKIGESAWNKATALWQKLRPSIEKRPVMKDSVSTLIQNLSDPDAQAALRFQIKQLLKEEPELMLSISTYLQTAQSQSSANVSASFGSVVAGGNISESNILTGNNNRITSG